MGMGVEDFEDGCDEQALGLAEQYESTFDKLATVQDYTELVENHKPLPGSARPHSFNTGKKDGQVDGKQTLTPDNPQRVTPDNPQRVMKSECKNMFQWCCGQIVNGGPHATSTMPGPQALKSRKRVMSASNPKRSFLRAVRVRPQSTTS